MLKPHEPTRTLRSSEQDLLSVPPTDTTLGLRRFSVSDFARLFEWRI